MSGLRELAAKATPGPWRVDADDENLEVRAPEHAVARLAGPMTMGEDADPGVKARALADARLVALAPDMAALLADTFKDVNCYRVGRACREVLPEDQWCGNCHGLARFDALNQNTT